MKGEESEDETLSRVGIPWICYRGRLGPSGPKLEKESENEFLDPLRPRAQKGRKQSRKRVKIVEKQSIYTLLRLGFDSVFDFLGAGAKRPRELIFGLFFQLWA